MSAAGVADLKGVWVLITGAASGIGQECALAFAREGGHIVAVDLDAARLAETTRMVTQIGVRCLEWGCDVSDPAAVTALADAVMAQAGAPHVTINNAGIGYIGPFLDTPLEAWQRIIAVNLMGVVHIARAFLPAMIAAGGQRSLVNVASAAGLYPVPNLSAYSATKHAVLGLSDALSMELDGSAVHVTVVCPGVINTPIVRNRAAVAQGVPAATLDKLEQHYRTKGVHPAVVAARIVRAVKRGEDIVLAGPSAASVYFARRFSRGLLRRLTISGARQMGYAWQGKQENGG